MLLKLFTCTSEPDIKNSTSPIQAQLGVHILLERNGVAGDGEDVERKEGRVAESAHRCERLGP